MGVIPHDLDAEMAVIGWCLARPDDAGIVLDRLSPADFYRPAHQAVLDGIRAGVLTAPELSARTGVDGRVIVEAMRASAGPWEVNNLVEFVADLAARRRTLAALDDARAIATDTQQDLHGAAELLRPVLVEAEDPAQVRPTTLAEFMAVPDDPYDWIVPDLLERGERLLVTAGEGVGKSTLLRQFALAVSAGIHPFRLTPIPPKRVLLVDVENSDRQSRREIRKLMHLIDGADQSMLAVEIRTQGLNLDNGPDRRWLSGLVKAHQADLLVIGPLYRIQGAPGKYDIGGEGHAKQLSEALDAIRKRYGCALLMETHAPHGSMGSRDLRPFGSSLWLRWPEFGVGLRRNTDLGPKAFELVPWRGPRDQRDWPRKLEHGQSWPWIATYDQGRF